MKDWNSWPWVDCKRVVRNRQVLGHMKEQGRYMRILGSKLNSECKTTWENYTMEVRGSWGWCMTKVTLRMRVIEYMLDLRTMLVMVRS
jgi:hypothetical protein